MALVRAARKFDPQQGVPFDGFAYRRIRGAVVDNYHPADPAKTTNADRLRQEIYDLIAVAEMLFQMKLHGGVVDPGKIEARKAKVLRYMEVSPRQGTLQ